jgi:hypothetical protein
MGAAMIAKLLQLQALGCGLFVFCRSVVTILALRTFERDDVPHDPTQIYDLGLTVYDLRFTRSRFLKSSIVNRQS